MENMDTGRVRIGHDGGLSGRPVRDLTRDFVSEAQRLLRAEVKLARWEIKEEAKNAGKSAAIAGAGGALVYGGVLALIFCVAAALATAWPVWLALLVTGGVFVMIGTLFAIGGATRFRQIKVGPRETRSQLEEDRRWARETVHAVRSKKHANA